MTLLAILTLMGASMNSSMAAKPAPKTTTLATGPMVTVDTCRVANHTDQAVDVFMELCIAPTDNSASADCIDISPTGVGNPAPVVGTLAPGHFEINLATRVLAGFTYTCELTHSGSAGDISGMACGLVTASTSTCMPLQAHQHRSKFLAG